MAQLPGQKAHQAKYDTALDSMYWTLYRVSSTLAKCVVLGHSPVQYSVMQCCTVLHNVLQCSKVFYSVVLCCTIIYGVVHCCSMFDSAVQCCTLFQSVVECNIML